MSYNYFEDTREKRDIPDYLTRAQLAAALKDALKREEELQGQVYELEEIISGLTKNGGNLSD